MRRPDLTLALFPLLALAACGTTPTSAPMDHHGQGAHHRGHRFDDDPAQWAKRFDDPARDAWQKPDAVIARLGLAADAQVADVGAGTGYFAVRLARAVPHGAVWAADIEPTMVAWLADRAAREDVVNLRPLLAKPADPALPTPVDVIFICNTWHHVADRPAWLKAATAQLKPGGRIAILDYRVDFEGDGPPKDLRLTQEAVIAELQAAGFSLQDREDGEFPRQYLLVFGRPTP